MELAESSFISGFLDDVRAARTLFLRPQRLTLPMVALFAIIPFYLVIGAFVAHGHTYRPETRLDALFPLVPAWSLVYLSLFLAALLPVFVVHQQELVRRVVWMYLTTWLTAFAVFLLYPTAAPVHADVLGGGFTDAVMRGLYDSDVSYNCFPSLHVAQCYLAASCCHKVHRRTGMVAFAWATLVSLSTLYTKQHYVADVVGGMALAFTVSHLFLRGYPREATPAAERRLAPALALGAFAVYGLGVSSLWIAYLVTKP
ncbi:MAG TPA: phosphatase PAP2 family protein [Gammaproteobacteria bacterium]